MAERAVTTIWSYFSRAFLFAEERPKPLTVKQRARMILNLMNIELGELTAEYKPKIDSAKTDNEVWALESEFKREYLSRLADVSSPVPDSVKVFLAKDYRARSEMYMRKFEKESKNSDRETSFLHLRAAEMISAQLPVLI